METAGVSGLRSRSRSKTPFLRSSCDRESCGEGADHIHQKSGRKTPVKRSTPIKQLRASIEARNSEPIEEVEEEIYTSPPAHRTRNALKNVVKTSDYSSEEQESPDRLRNHKEVHHEQESKNYQYEYEHVSTTTNRQPYSAGDISLSPITQTNAHHVTSHRSGYSPAHSACSTDSSFAELALADVSRVFQQDPSLDHLPSRLYKSAGEYWNKYPKTDYTYSPLSRDRVELAPGQVAVPNMSRRSLQQFRLTGPHNSVDELDCATLTSTLRKRYQSGLECSDDEGFTYRRSEYRGARSERWLLTRLLLSVYSSVASSLRSAYTAVAGEQSRSRTARRHSSQGLASKSASVAAAPFVWIYTLIKTIITTTVTTVTETITPNHVDQRYSSYAGAAQAQSSRRRWPWALLLLLPLIGYGSYYTYENYENMSLPTLPNFTDFNLPLLEFSAIEFSKLSLPSFSLPEINITLPEIDLPEVKIPEMPQVYYEYKDIVQNRVGDASEYIKVVGESCYEELRRFWKGVIG